MKPKRQSKGMALAFVLFALVIVSAIGLGMLLVMIGGSKGSYAYQNNTKALNYAMAGIQRALAELEVSATWPGNACACETENIGNGTFKVSVSTNGIFTQWLVNSTGTSGGASRTIMALMIPQTYAQFSYFSNNENLANEPNQEWWIGGNVVEGTFGTNGFFNFYAKPAFTGKVTSAQGCFPATSAPGFPTYPGFSGDNCGSNVSGYATQDPYFDPANNTYKAQNPPDPTNPKYFYHYWSGYGADAPVAYNNSATFSFQGGQPYNQWPTISEAALTQNAAPLSSSGGTLATVNAVTGDVKMVLNSNGTVTVIAGGQINSSGSQANTYTGTNLTNITYTIPSEGATIAVQDGNVMVSGTLKGELTIMTSPSTAYPVASSSSNKCFNLSAMTNGAPPACGNINIEGNVLYNDKTVGANSYSGADRLGIVASGDVNVDPYVAGANVEIDGALMSLPQSYTVTSGQTTTTTVIHTGVGVLGYSYSCWNKNNDSGAACDTGGTYGFCYAGPCPPAENNFTLFGGMIADLGGDPVGIFNSGNGQIISGYNQILYQDTNLITTPPPNFPYIRQAGASTPMQIVQWQDSNALGH